MKIRNGYVTNSSSTSFVLIADNELSLDFFLKAIGVGADSPLAGIFEELYHLIVDEKVDPPTHCCDVTTKIGEDVAAMLKDKIQLAIEQGKFIYAGNLSSESNSVEGFFCTDSFEVSKDGFYLNCVDNFW